MNIMVFDTETTSIDKPFCYDIGYTIWNVETATKLLKRSYVAEQIWHNAELFTTAYYAEKRAEYIGRLRSRQCEMKKFGYITQIMCRDIENYEIKDAYAFNSPFDDRVFDYNCDWFKCKNPFDDVAIHDIRGYVHKCLAFTPDYQAFCEDNGRFTESGNYSTTAETVYQYMTRDSEFIEAHTALADSEIELDILLLCIERGCEWNKDYKVYRSICRKGEKELIVKTCEGERVRFPYESITVHKEKDRKTKVYLRG